MRWALWIAGLALLMTFNMKIMTPLFGYDTGGKIGSFLWSLMTGLAWGIYGVRYIVRRK